MADQAVNSNLDETRRASGATLLKLTDEIGFGAVGAAWVYNRDSDRWWFLLISPMVDTKGPLWIYQRFLQIFQKWQLPAGITPMDIRVASPREQVFRSVSISVGTPAKETEQPPIILELKDVTLNDVTAIDAMAIYRMNNSKAATTRDSSKLFDLRVRQFLAAA